MNHKPEVSSGTPASLGFSMPAEWEKHEATWIGWPHNRTDWPGKIAPIYWVYGEIVRKIAVGEIVRIIVESATHEAQAKRILFRVGADLSQIEFFRIPSNRGWTRDFGPFFVKKDAKQSEVAITKFRFNAWAKYPDWNLDNEIARKAAKALGLHIFRAEANGRDVVLEGGSIDINGRGTLMTTEECLLDKETQARNPYLSQSQFEEALRQYLGVTNILWLGKGIAGDDTHGHIDDICRFVNANTVVLCQESDKNDYNYAPLMENRERLQSMRLEDRGKIEVIELPMPAPLYHNGQRLPASYANFYICNAAVLVPTFNDPNDRIALGVLAEIFKDRLVVGIHAVDLVWGLGTLHCLTQQQPAG
ncbi:MAG TPA: agmatine deiminase family protein [Blastocatellia bacterium]|nr:agmatine deiminase family protein [Blastocatellia bacterium]